MSNSPLNHALWILWDPEPRNTCPEEPIVCLGHTYLSSESDCVEGTWPSEFLKDVESKLWFTYRQDFPPIPRAENGPSPLSLGGVLRGSGVSLSSFTSDIGWGCMVRTAQCLLANALAIMKLGKHWRPSSRQRWDRDELDIACRFNDDPVADFSIHKFVQHGQAACGKMPGEWFGPSAAASSIRALCERTSEAPGVYVSKGSGFDIYEDEILELLDSSSHVLILLGIRLGIEKVNAVYWQSLKQFFKLTQSVGVAGGRPSSSHYFFGYQHEHLFYLDPHQPKPALRLQSQDVHLQENTLHTRRVRTLHLNEMDPSMLAGFLISGKEDWYDWRRRITQFPYKHIVNITDQQSPTDLSYLDLALSDSDIDRDGFAVDDDESSFTKIKCTESGESRFGDTGGSGDKDEDKYVNIAFPESVAISHDYVNVCRSFPYSGSSDLDMSRSSEEDVLVSSPHLSRDQQSWTDLAHPRTITGCENHF